MVAPAKFCHVVYRTHQFDTMIAWYQKVLEARVQHRSEKIAFLTYDDEHHRVAIIDIGPRPAGAPVPAKGGQGVAHVAFAWRNVGELIDTYKRLKKDGILPVRPIRHGLTLSMYYDDPDGNNLEFQIDTLDEQLASAFMRSAAFAADPIGQLFDPEQLVARYETGEPIDDLVFRTDQPEAFRRVLKRGGTVQLPLRAASGPAAAAAAE